MSRDINSNDLIAAGIGAAVSGLGVPAPYSGPLLPKWRKALNGLRAGNAGNIRLAFYGDSKTRFFPLAGGAPKSKSRRVGELLASAGVPAITDTIFGCGGAGTMAEAVSYDPKLSGFSGWAGGNVSLGGAAFYTAGTNPGTFTPSKPVDRVTVYFVQAPGQATFSVTKGSETFAQTSNGTAALGKVDVVFTTKDASAITIARTGGGNFNLVGIVAWDSAVSAVEIANFGVSGVKSSFQADISAPHSPLNALGSYAPHLTVINLGTNDLNAADVPLATFLANMGAIIDKAKVSGDAIILWPSIGGAGTNGGSDADRLTWKTALRALAVTKSVPLLDEEVLLGGRAAAAADWMYDALHELPPATFLEATALTHLILRV
ncbi:SGNH/GDSL hydrolase family protein [Sphingomonas sp. BK580]|uniref:SGNH/GDSL hydrolase family protein n=1 Tax=Sphingomonas sp. BK580 TaxID=2586972 RepID=UPI001622C620|nr:SGNH/GDSL hydrolase family protein [Sphingomonas sp. BK580]MBB3693007.1 hypothetical protein [Sphingomonas sp. BK580]